MVLESSARPQTSDTHMKLRHTHILPTPEQKNLFPESEKSKSTFVQVLAVVFLDPGLILSLACWFLAAAPRCVAFIPLGSPLIRLPPPPRPSEVWRKVFEAQPHQSAETSAAFASFLGASGEAGRLICDTTGR